MDYRTIVVGYIKNSDGKYLICKKPKHLGVYAGQWAVPGGGMEPGETLHQALKREINEEVGLEVGNIQPLCFFDDTQEKLFPDGTKKLIYMIYLIFTCDALSNDIKFDGEFEKHAWVSKVDLDQYDLNKPTKMIFSEKIQWPN